jgi:restriction system protein
MPMDVLGAVEAVLRDESLHVRELTERVLARGLWTSKGKTPQATVGARVYTDIEKKGSASRFIQTGKATFGLNPEVQASAKTETRDARDGTPAAFRRDVTITPSAARAVAGANAPMVKKRLSFTDATEDVLRRYGKGKPMHYRDITATILQEGLVKTSGKTPEATLYAQVIQENARAEKREAVALCPPRQGTYRSHGVAGAWRSG